MLLRIFRLFQQLHAHHRAKVVFAVDSAVVADGLHKLRPSVLREIPFHPAELKHRHIDIIRSVLDLLVRVADEHRLPRPEIRFLAPFRNMNADISVIDTVRKLERGVRIPCQQSNRLLGGKIEICQRIAAVKRAGRNNRHKFTVAFPAHPSKRNALQLFAVRQCRLTVLLQRYIAEICLRNVGLIKCGIPDQHQIRRLNRMNHACQTRLREGAVIDVDQTRQLLPVDRERAVQLGEAGIIDRDRGFGQGDHAALCGRTGGAQRNPAVQPASFPQLAFVLGVAAVQDIRSVAVDDPKLCNIRFVAPVTPRLVAAPAVIEAFAACQTPQLSVKCFASRFTQNIVIVLQLHVFRVRRNKAQVRAVVERVFHDGHAVPAPEQHAGERGAVLERRNADGLNRLGQRNVFQRGAAVKCVRRDAVDRFFLAVNDDLAVILADAVRRIDYDDLSVRFHVEAAVIRCARRRKLNLRNTRFVELFIDLSLLSFVLAGHIRDHAVLEAVRRIGGLCVRNQDFDRRSGKGVRCDPVDPLRQPVDLCISHHAVEHGRAVLLMRQVAVVNLIFRVAAVYADRRFGSVELSAVLCDECVQQLGLHLDRAVHLLEIDRGQPVF